VVSGYSASRTRKLVQAFTLFTIFIHQGDDKMATKKRTFKNNPIRLLLGLLVGGLAGVITMLLFAPQSGKQTRAQIEEKSILLRDQTNKNIKKAVKQVRSETKRIAAGVQDKAGELKQIGQDKLVEGLDRVSAALDTGKTAVEAA
jgi:gas vesicle protein